MLSIAQHFRGTILALSLSLGISDTLLPFSLAARVKTYSLLFPAPGFPGKTLPDTKQEARSRNETSPFSLYAPFSPHPGTLRARRQGRSGGNSPSSRLALPQPGDRETRVAGGEAALLQ